MTWLAGITHVPELFSRKQRVFITMFFEYGFCFGYMYLGLVAYLVRDWRMVQLAISLFTLIGLACVMYVSYVYFCRTFLFIEKVPDRPGDTAIGPAMGQCNVYSEVCICLISLGCLQYAS